MNISLSVQHQQQFQRGVVNLDQHEVRVQQQGVWLMGLRPHRQQHRRPQTAGVCLRNQGQSSSYIYPMKCYLRMSIMKIKIIS